MSRLRRILRPSRRIIIQPYRGFCSRVRLRLRGRVLVEKPIALAKALDSPWVNLRSSLKRFLSGELPYARVTATFQGQAIEATADREGFFEVSLELPLPPPPGSLWHLVHIELTHPPPTTGGTVEAWGEVFHPTPRARFAVLSDIDDTVLHTGSGQLLRMAASTLLGNAHTRLPIPGMIPLLQAFHAGEEEANPAFFVSSSPWNLYDLLSDFFRLQGFPGGPILFLRDWNLRSHALRSSGHRGHKLALISELLEVCDLPFILLGDSLQQDPEIYREIMALYPGRILSAYIRLASPAASRLQTLWTLAEDARREGQSLILAEDAMAIADHAAGKNWIPPGALPSVREDQENRDKGTLV